MIEFLLRPTFKAKVTAFVNVSDQLRFEHQRPAPVQNSRNLCFCLHSLPSFPPFAPHAHKHTHTHFFFLLSREKVFDACGEEGEKGRQMLLFSATMPPWVNKVRGFSQILLYVLTFDSSCSGSKETVDKTGKSTPRCINWNTRLGTK